MAVLRFFNNIYNDTVNNPSCSSMEQASVDSSTLNFKKLELTLTSNLESKIAAAKEKFDKAVSSLEMATMQLFSYGKDYIKRKKLSPDAILQLAFQVGYNLNHFAPICSATTSLQLVKLG